MVLKNVIAPEKRRKKLRELLEQKPLVRVIESHNGLSALVANDAKLKLEGKTHEFDALWGSGFTDSASKGYPDADIVGVDSRINTINEILNVTNKPLIVDGDTGRDPNNFEYLVSRLERLGVSAIIIEDKKFPKRNSLISGRQILEDPDIFASKIKRGKRVLLTKDFMIIARIESFISDHGIEDALLRAKRYLMADADGIMIHSRKKRPDEILNFAKEYSVMCKELGFRRPLISVPTSYNTITEKELEKNGFNIVIYANQLLRAAHKSMENVCNMILKHGRVFEAESFCTPVVDIFKKVGFMDIRERDLEELRRLSKGDHERSLEE
ncbi:MAG: phosphoenolpyruvate mutase [Candidatus Hodarchaeota archaeon]